MITISLNKINELDKKLIDLAIKIREKSYCPYSNYAVGAALLAENDEFFLGCNIESSDYTLTTHAEMLAVDNMVQSGNRKIKKIAIALIGKGEIPATPCGLCRQKILEFDKEGNCEIIIANLNHNNEIVNITYFTLSELLPFSFNSSFLKYFLNFETSNNNQ